MQTELRLRVLHLEDNPFDAELIQDYLENDGLRCDILRVDNRRDFASALGSGPFDLYLCDYNIPGYDGISALKLIREREAVVPVLLISGALDEEEAVKSLRCGATDFLVKQRLNRLGTAVRRALQEAEHMRVRHKAEEALRVSEERFRLLVENSSDLVIEATLDGRISYASPNFQGVLGRLSSDAVGHNTFDWIHPDDVGVARAAFRQSEIQTQFRCLHEDGSYRWLDVTGRVFRRADGEQRASITARDITERRQLEDQLRQSQKMETVGHLAGGVAHDFNNILTIIQGQASLLRDETELTPFAQEAVAGILEASSRAASLTRQLLTFSRKQVMQIRPLDLNAVVNDMTRMLRRTLGDGISLDVQAAPDLPSVEADQGMMEQIILNLAVNSRDAMPEGGRLAISTSAVTMDPVEGFAKGGLRTPGVCLRVSDSGCGIPPENLPHIFELFFTTKEVHKGTGLGLATVFGIVKQHRGAIRLSSEVGRGTTFQILLPACGEPSRPNPKREEESEVRGGHETILVVDDEPEVRALIVLVLKEEGYEILEAGSGKQALEIFAAEKGAIHLLLTDMSMPDGMTGKELAAALRAESPSLPVAFTSGYSADFVGETLAMGGEFHFLQKPFSPKALASTVRECLDARG